MNNVWISVKGKTSDDRSRAGTPGSLSSLWWKEVMKNTNLSEGSIAKGFILFALPLFLGSLFQQLYGTVDLIFVGNYMGKTEAAAVGASGILVTCLIGLFTGISVGAGVITAQYWGAKNKENVQKSMENALFLALAGGIFLMSAGQLLADWALRALHTPASILAQALVYIRIYLLAIMSMIVYNMCAGILRAMGDSEHRFWYWQPVAFKCVHGLVFYCYAWLGCGRCSFGDRRITDFYGNIFNGIYFPKRKFTETEMEDRKKNERKDYKNRDSAGNTGDDSYIVKSGSAVLYQWIWRGCSSSIYCLLPCGNHIVSSDCCLWTEYCNLRRTELRSWKI